MFQLMVLVRLFFTLSDEVKGQAKNGLKGQLSAVLTHTHTHTREVYPDMQWTHTKTYGTG